MTRLIKGLTVERRQLVDLPDHCLLIRTTASGICGTDLHVVQGAMESKDGFPVVLGHEATGIVQAAGSQTEGFAKGDRVVVTAITPCLSVDVNESRLGVARDLGASSCLNALAADPVEETLDSIPDGVDLAFECVGKVETIEQAFRTLASGGKLVVIGPRRKVPISPSIPWSCCRIVRSPVRSQDRSTLSAIIPGGSISTGRATCPSTVSSDGGTR